MKRIFRFAYAEILWAFYQILATLQKTVVLPFIKIPSSTPDKYMKYVVEKDVPIQMRDGVRLFADVYRPPIEGKFPVVLIRLPYGKQEYYTHMPAYGRFWSKKGYVCVIQDVRGKWASEGEFGAMAGEGDDGYDALEWIARQPWCDGNIGMMGESYYAHTQWAAAITRHPNLKCIAPMDMDTDSYRLNFPGGAFSMQLIGGWIAGQLTKTVRNTFRIDYWHLPLINLDDDAGLPAAMYKEAVEHPSRDTYWDERSLHNKIDQVNVPVLHIGGWYDTFTNGTLDGWRMMREGAQDHDARAKQWLMMGPIDHEHTTEHTHRIGKLQLGGEWDTAWLFDRHEQFYDHFLKGVDNGWGERSPVEIFVIGDDMWRFESEWPLARTEYTKYYLHSNGSAATRSGDGILNRRRPTDEPSDQYVYDPEKPVTYSLGVDYWSLAKYMKDRAKVEERKDVLVYTSEPMKDDQEITGPINVTLYASSSAKDTDFTAALVDVFPGGYCHLIQEGIIRARYREDDRNPTLITPGEVYKYAIDLWATSFVIKVGHRIRVEISSSNFNRFDRNPNTGSPFGRDAEVIKATQTIYHTEEYPSHITLPLILR
jgi:putative CocE/NonD family hydrolase